MSAPAKVQHTYDYAKFKSITGNRFLNPQHVKRVAESMREINLMQYQPVMINSKGYLIDGQHRVEAAKMLDEPVFYVEVPDLGLNEIRLLNSNMKAWSLRDYVSSYAKTGKKDYQILLDFSDRYKIPLTTSASILCGQAVGMGGGTMSNILRQGKFVIVSLKSAEILARKLKDIQPFTFSGAWRSREFIRALLFIYAKGASHVQLLEQLKKHGKFEVQPDHRAYILLLQDIYNYQKKGRLLLFV